MPQFSISRRGTLRLQHAAPFFDQNVRVPGQVAYLKLLPDSPRLVSAGSDGAVRIWSTVNGKEVWCLTPRGGTLRAIAVSPTGDYLAAGYADRAVTIWGLQSGSEVASFAGLGQDLLALGFSPEGGVIAAAFADGAIQGIDTATGRLTFSIKTAAIPPARVCLAPTLSHAAIGDAKGTVWVVELPTGRVVFQKQAHLAAVHSICFSARDTLLATASGDIVKIWRIKPGAESAVVLNRDGGRSSAMEFSPDETTIACAGSGPCVEFYAVDTGELLYRVAHSLTKEIACLSISSDASLLACAGNGSRIALIDLKQRRPSLTFVGHRAEITDLEFSPDGTTLASSDTAGSLRVWKVSNPTEEVVVSEGGRPIHALSYIPQGSALAWGGDYPVIRVKQALTSQSHDEIKVADGVGVQAILSVPSGKSLVAALLDGRIQLWSQYPSSERAVLGASPVLLRYPPYPIRLARSRGDAFFFTTSACGVVECDVRSLNATEVLRSADTIQALAYSGFPDTLAVGSSDLVHVWLRGEVRPSYVLKGHRGDVLAVKFSPQGNLIATAGADGRVFLWDVSSGERVRSLQGHIDSINAIDFSPDGRLLASGGRDGILLIWDIVNATYKSSSGRYDEPLDGQWYGLGRRDKEGLLAARTLFSKGDDVVSFLEQKLLEKPDVRKLEQFISQLEADDIGVREQAIAGLAELAHVAEPILAEVEKTSRSIDVRHRVRALIRSLENPLLASDAAIRRMRAVWMLEAIGSSRAVQALESVGSLSLSSHERALAREALRRVHLVPE